MKFGIVIRDTIQGISQFLQVTIDQSVKLITSPSGVEKHAN